MPVNAAPGERALLAHVTLAAFSEAFGLPVRKLPSPVQEHNSHACCHCAGAIWAVLT